jgi:molybdate-binding protein/DNA-binding XRE family transcriptional regulator
LAKAAGVSRQAISAIESGRAQPGVGLALSVARALDASVEDLFGLASGASIEPDPATLAGRRAATATVAGRRVNRQLDPLDPLATPERTESVAFVAGCEPALALLAAHVKNVDSDAVWFATSNRDALADLRERRVHAALVHGSNEEVQRLVRRAGDDAFDVYEFAMIEEGWIIGRGNPKKFRGARDLARGSMRLANRAVGAGARTLLDTELRRAGVASQTIAGYGHAVAGHADVARAVAFGYADVGLGVAGVADAFRLSFIPLRNERCVLVIRRSDCGHTGVAAMVSALRSTAFRRDLAAFGPYDITRLGETL